MLHILRDFPIVSSDLEQTPTGDTVLLTEHALLGVNRDKDSLTLLKNASRRLHFCVRQTELSSKGLSSSQVSSTITVLDDIDYQAITEENTILKSWN